ncbi:hypothetical protein FTUN_6007 [Frigoriglobus tundricola]|uniref:Uncharacterized protein n=1 Tax=Frigoriglobus tundricola TaxID=2774151 RepID=A0A6M5YWE1_9BACT|nr:hypothetical protein FTUN_6007 [Frigoriglobus tundricola]
MVVSLLVTARGTGMGQDERAKYRTKHTNKLVPFAAVC